MRRRRVQATAGGAAVLALASALALTGCGGGGGTAADPSGPPAASAAGGESPGGNASPDPGGPVDVEPRWQTELPPGTVVETAAGNDRVYVALNGDPHRVVALDPADGSELWTYEHGGAARREAPIEDIEPAPDGLVFVSGPDVHRIGLDGELVWSAPGIAGSVFGPEAVAADDGGVVIGTDNGAAGLASEDGANRWTVEGEDVHAPGTRLAGAQERRILLTEELAIVQGGLAGYFTVTAIDRDGGDVVWHRETTATPRATLAGGVLVHQQEPGMLTGVDPATGEELWRLPGLEEGDGLNHPIWVAGDTVVTHHIGSIQGVDAATGTVSWTTPAPAAADFSERIGTTLGDGRLALVVDGGLALIAGDGTLTQLGLPQPGNLQTVNFAAALGNEVYVTSRTSRTDEGPYAMAVPAEGNAR
ncbi:PQQ-binding-like beta-propeller repeat protein [Streptomyces sp. DSM 44917]|uniref:PQQ-binding-like beta-propeller repeat protein n=1 Tax=Streptomyces boetiae TaxID=3075541 RepID=A0ABU2L865_9ACTN|nr:PQQ-binding-like beta-propeller repeat protein [Streptomyces sp. DSM 44917]MDT0307537.1 PQQ-binding-like beta-propeller repeat protein [Streptomyces sp. DSM 44917]